MSLFGVIQTDEAIFMGDKTRIDVSQCFVTPDEVQTITLEIKADAAASFISVTSSRHLDWIYSSKGSKTITVKLTSGVKTEEFTKTVTVLDLADEKLFSKDTDLVPYEPEVYSYLPAKWSSFNVIHWRVQKQILKWLDEKRIWTEDGSKLTLAEILDLTELRDLSVCMVLALIFEGVKNQVGDVFSEKAKHYADLATQKSQAATIRLDVNKDGTNEMIDNLCGRLVRV